jgi:hypothetical protein
MVLQIPVGIFVDMSVVQPNFVVLYPRERIAELPFAGSQGLDLRAVEHDAGFVGLQDVIIPAGF